MTPDIASFGTAPLVLLRAWNRSRCLSRRARRQGDPAQERAREPTLRRSTAGPSRRLPLTHVHVNGATRIVQRVICVRRSLPATCRGRLVRALRTRRAVGDITTARRRRDEDRRLLGHLAGRPV